MKQHIPYPSIQQYRNAVQKVTMRATCIGKDEEGKPLYDDRLPKPVLKFRGTVKIHGTNAAVCYSPQHGLWAQSREHIITPESDNMGFARFLKENEEAFIILLCHLAQQHGITLDAGLTLAVFGEWAGKGILKGTAIQQLPKAFYIFGARVLEGWNGETYQRDEWLPIGGIEHEPASCIYNIERFGVYEAEVDFNDPEKAKEHLTRLTLSAEAECPVAKQFGVSGVGEGIVWYADFDGKRIFFKTKGEKHAVSRTKDVVAPDAETLENIAEFVDYAVTQNRFTQALASVFGHPKEADIRRLGEVIKWMHQDILKEESDVMACSGLEWKRVAQSVSKRTREMFLAL